jgi:hypothetical protein
MIHRITLGAVTAAAWMAGARPTAAASPIAFARPIGTMGAPGAVAGGAAGGPLLAVESGGAVSLPVGSDPVHGSFSFGARAGWSFVNGLALHVRYDDLGIRPVPGSGPLQLVTAGLRYSVPFLIPLPFAEVGTGAAFAAGGVEFGAEAGIGLSIPLGAHVLVDIVGRDWFVPIAGELRQTVTAGLGLTVTFAAQSR